MGETPMPRNPVTHCGREREEIARPKRDAGEEFILKRLRAYKVERVVYLPGAGKEPRKYTPAYLDHLDQYAAEIQLGRPDAPAIKRVGDRFILDRPERKRTRYKSIRSVLRKLLPELAIKELARGLDRGKPS